MRLLILAIICLISGAAMADELSPCGIYRENLYRAGIDPYTIHTMTAYCVSNVENLHVDVLTDKKEIEDFRKREFIASPVLVDKSMEGNERRKMFFYFSFFFFLLSA